MAKGPRRTSSRLRGADAPWPRAARLVARASPAILLLRDCAKGGDLRTRTTGMLKTKQTPGDTGWFVNDRFGLFIHWGLYALPARHEWVRHNEQIPIDVYDSK